ncbi:hypothetical protein CU254_23090 [Amycolatopsis sp. AA4]|uniref:hypothetical protein n=1 Tax=Actinomycetes TaxID=1760 RepID=UPI0001B545B2|nr:MULTISPECIES: hypothetical protein [Actinomycetes]ATY13005.1 hypothetical protein CU254_23090 [Amycolatopsis sp. AA4]EFL08874.1 predicted protein [Streptomyces sp. AA4]
MSACEQAASDELTRAIDGLHSAVERLRNGGSATITAEKLSALVADATSLYTASAQSAKSLPRLDPGLATSTDAVVLISAIMAAHDLNTFDLALWLSRVPAIEGIEQQHVW